MTKSVFLNYRREDSSGSSGRMFDLLSHKLTGARVFMDVDALEPGVDFTRAMDEQLAGCDYFIAVVGPNWANAQAADGRRRLDNPNDYVRVEIEAALRRGIRVVPVLVDGAKMPQPNDVPESLKPFCTRNAFVVAHHKFASDIDDLAIAIKRNIGLETKASRAEESGHSTSSWADDLLSFKGRMARKAYWWWNLILLPITLLIQHLLLLTVGGSILEGAAAMTVQHHQIMQIGTLPIWWFVFALALKRIHDFNAGWGFLSIYIAITLVFVLLVMLSATVDSDATRRGTMAAGEVHGIFAGFGVLWIIIWIGIGCIPGTPGPNRYGPDPLKARAGNGR